MKNIIKIILTILNVLKKSASTCSSEYGAEPCTFTPAPPGRTPPCARPGFTYCEHPANYPGKLINYLIEKWRYDYSTLLIYESLDEFNSYFSAPESKYGPKPIYGPPSFVQHSYVNIGASPSYAAILPQNIPLQDYRNVTSGFVGTTQNLPYNGVQDQRNFFNQLNVHANIQPQSQAITLQHYNSNGWWTRRTRDLNRNKYSSRRKKRTTPQNNMFPNNLLSNNVTDNRKKRQSGFSSGQSLCQSRSQFITPRAALNNKGNWMYVVNMPEVNTKYTQLVKSETCISQQCSALCGLPAGYTSRCEQKYVQKRLVALEGTGNLLYSDVFWIPSCCDCIISNTNT